MQPPTCCFASQVNLAVASICCICRDVQSLARDLHQGPSGEVTPFPRHRPHSCHTAQSRVGNEVDPKVSFCSIWDIQKGVAVPVKAMPVPQWYTHLLCSHLHSSCQRLPIDCVCLHLVQRAMSDNGLAGCSSNCFAERLVAFAAVEGIFFSGR